MWPAALEAIYYMNSDWIIVLVQDYVMIEKKVLSSQTTCDPSISSVFNCFDFYTSLSDYSIVSTKSHSRIKGVFVETKRC